MNNEKIDIIPHSDDLKLYVQGSLAPAENLQIEIDEPNKTIVVSVPEDQLSLAIGRGGQNVRLAAKLVGYKITIKADGKVKTEATGEEQYEIDTFKGLSAEAREFLIQSKLTTSNDLIRFKDKWLMAEELEKDQVELISKQVEQVEAADEARRIEREAEDKRLADSFKAPVQAETEETGKSQD